MHDDEMPGQENDRREVMRYWAWIADRNVLLHDAIEAARRVALTPERAAHRGSAVREHVVDGAEMAALRVALARLDERARP